MKIEARPWRPQDLLDDLQELIDEKTDRYLNTERTVLCMALSYLKEYFAQLPDDVPTMGGLAQEYLNVCNHDCAGDTSTGIPPCPFYNFQDVDEANRIAPGRCRLRSMLHNLGEKPCGEKLPPAVLKKQMERKPEQPPCYLEEKTSDPYPLCSGRGFISCAHCCLWAKFDENQDESRVNPPLTLNELREKEGEPVWIEHENGGEWVVVAWNIHDEIAGARLARLDADNYGSTGLGGWFAYRHKLERGRHEQ